MSQGFEATITAFPLDELASVMINSLPDPKSFFFYQGRKTSRLPLFLQLFFSHINSYSGFFYKTEKCSFRIDDFYTQKFLIAVLKRKKPL
jgi:hypothetical protein